MFQPRYGPLNMAKSDFLWFLCYTLAKCHPIMDIFISFDRAHFKLLNGTFFELYPLRCYAASKCLVTLSSTFL